MTPKTNKKITFKTVLGVFTGEVNKSVHSESGEEFIFFVCDPIKENRHWTFFKPNEVFEWQYL